MEYLKLFENHTEYEAFIQTDKFVKPNVSHCIAENEIHYNAKPYTLTPKQLVEYTHSFLMTTYEKFFMHRQEQTDPEVKMEYSNLCEQKMSRACSQLSLEKMLSYRNLVIDGANCVTLRYRPNDTVIFDLDILSFLQITKMRFDYNNMYIETEPNLYKTNEIYNGNDVFYISTWYVTGGNDDGTIEDLTYNDSNNTITYGDNMVLLSPHNTFANFTIAYPDGNGGYTTTKPATFELSPSIVDETLVHNNEWISLNLFHSQDQEINTRLENAITALRSDFRNWFNGDFSDLSVLDDIKLEVPKDIYEIIKNPWTYLDEDDIFNGPW